jgi:2-hydroxychromene-2-carboxylate isomerase
MTVIVHSYTIYHSPNAYLGTVLLRRAIANLPDVELVRRPIYVPRERGVMIAEFLGGKENRNVGSYLREDCRRWADRFKIPFSYPVPEIFHQRAEHWAISAFHREELPARAFYAADAEKRDVLDRALFDAAWVEGLDVNEPETIRWASQRAGLDPDDLMMMLAEPGPGRRGAECPRGIRAAAVSWCAHRRRQWPALLRQGPGRLGRRRLSDRLGPA